MRMISTDPKKIEWVLSRGVEHVLPSADVLRENMLSGKRLRIYHGIDPTGLTLHLGHAVALRKLAEFQELGHETILLIGDFTAMIGDPTDKSATRRQLTRDEVLANCRLYKEQASKFLDFEGPNATELRFNSEWLGKLSFADAIGIASHFTVQQMLERDMFEKRMREEKPIHLHEFLYPLMQGYDSVALDVDLEIGGNDQLFNMLSGRTLLREMKRKEKCVIALRLLVDPTGKKMGKTEGNMIAFTDAPEDMYGKVMSWSDDMIVPGFAICTDASEEELAKMKRAIGDGENPMTFKRELARRIVMMLEDAEAAEKAAEYFDRVHREHEKPEEIREWKGAEKEMPLADALVASGLVASKSEARRQIEQGGVKVDGRPVSDVKATVRTGTEGVVIQKGKRFFVKILPKETGRRL